MKTMNFFSCPIVRLVYSRFDTDLMRVELLIGLDILSVHLHLPFEALVEETLLLGCCLLRLSVRFWLESFHLIVHLLQLQISLQQYVRAVRHRFFGEVFDNLTSLADRHSSE